VAVAYHYETWQRNNPIPEEPREVPEETREEGDALVSENFVLSSRTVIAKREESGPFWELSQSPLPKGWTGTKTKGSGIRPPLRIATTTTSRAGRGSMYMLSRMAFGTLTQ
jgi:hypothetical protein